MIAEIKEYLEKPSHSGKRYLIKKIVGTKDNIEKKVLNYIDERMNNKSFIRVIEFKVVIIDSDTIIRIFIREVV